MLCARFNMLSASWQLHPAKSRSCSCSCNRARSLNNASKHTHQHTHTGRCPTPAGNSDGACDPCGRRSDGNWEHAHCRGNSQGANRVACFGCAEARALVSSQQGANAHAHACALHIHCSLAPLVYTTLIPHARIAGWGESGDMAPLGVVTNMHITDVDVDGQVPR